MKQLIKNYTFDASAKTVSLDDYSSINHEGILLITNVVDGALIYNFADPTMGGTVSGNTVTLEFDTTSMSDDDALMVFYDEAEVTLKDYLEAIHESLEVLSVLGAVRGPANDLRVNVTGGAIGVTGTLTTVTTVTNVTNMANMNGFGGYFANQMVPATQNHAAILSNINNVIVS